jgi:hypothetical protein
MNLTIRSRLQDRHPWIHFKRLQGELIARLLLLRAQVIGERFIDKTAMGGVCGRTREPTAVLEARNLIGRCHFAVIVTAQQR